jgi:transposase
MGGDRYAATSGFIMSRFIPFSRDQHYLLPPSMHEWLPEKHLARFIVEVVAQLDLSALIRRYSGHGSQAYHPAVMLALLVYGYATGVFSSRKIERATYDSVAFRYIAAEPHPDHDTLAHFRKTFLVELEGLFVQILSLAQAMKLVRLGKIALDGTKIKANTSKHKALSYGHIQKLESQLREEVQALLQRAAEVDQQEAAEELDLPAEIARREDRLKALADAKAKIEQRARERDAEAEAAYRDKLARREALRQVGKKPRGQAPKPPETGPRNQDQINLTDEASRIMPSSPGFVQAFNGQAAVDQDTMLVMATHVTQATNDKQQIVPMLEALDALPEPLGTLDTLVADNGYFSRHNVEACTERQVTPLIAMSRDVHHLPLAERLKPDEPPPLTEDPVIKMAHHLQTRAGREDYGRRKGTVEPVFGIIKQVLGFRQFSLRGLDQVAGEWTLVTMAYNLKRMHVLAG